VTHHIREHDRTDEGEHPTEVDRYTVSIADGSSAKHYTG